jgi:hypothetical protein
MKGISFSITEYGLRDNDHTAWFQYEIETDERTLQLEETMTFPVALPDSLESHRLLRALHIALATSYYKSFVPPVLRHPYKMSDLEASFWNTVYRHGLGEFLYVNKLDPAQLASFAEQDGLEITKVPTTQWSKESLLGIGGGKDSIVAGELLKKIGVKPTGFVLATGEILGQTQAVADVMDIELLPIKRVLDKQILAINEIEGSFNGHIPISLIFGLVGALLATAKGSKYVVVANEASSSIPQTAWGNEQVNHQWSKSIEFERLFQDYLHAYVSEELDYFSAIRPLTSVAIAKLFSQYPQYFETFTSDNSLFKIVQEKREHPRWSRESSKSLSSYILMAPWFTDEQLHDTFGRNFLDQADLREQFEAMLGKDGQSVLDCVGTPEELRISLGLLREQERMLDTSLMQTAEDQELIGDPAWLNSLLALDEHVLPEALKKALVTAMKERL